MITNHAIYVHRGTTSTVYFICKSRTNKAGLTSEDTRSSRRQRPKNQKGNKSERMSAMEIGVEEELVEYGVLITSVTVIYSSQHSILYFAARLEIL